MKSLYSDQVVGRPASVMAVYEVYSYSAVCRHRASLCSSATVFVLATTVICLLGPLLLAYRSHGFWLRTDSYREQPDVVFNHRYILMVETEDVDDPVVCSTFVNLKSLLRKHDGCPLVKSREEDVNKDGKNDNLHVSFEVQLRPSKAAYSVKLFLLFDYRLHKMSTFTMESMAFIQYSSGLPGARLDVVADLRLMQREPLRSRGRDVRYNTSVINTNTIFPEALSLQAILEDYARRNVSTYLSNIYPMWLAGRASDVPFIVSAIIHYPEETIMYRPGFWQVMKWAWVQYLSVLVVFLYVFRTIRMYVFKYQLVPTVVDMPWKKVM